MALKECTNCGRKFSAARTRCPWCKRRHHGTEEGPSAGFRVGLVAVGVLAAASAAYNLNRETGPPPAFEALHSADGAVETCRTGLEGELGMGSEPAGPFAAEYLGGGEYEVRGPVTVEEEGLPVQASVLCEVQFGEESGWRMLDAALDG